MTRIAAFRPAMKLGFGLLSGRSGDSAERRKLNFHSAAIFRIAATEAGYPQNSWQWAALVGRKRPCQHLQKW